MSFNIEEDKLKECKIVFDMFDKDKDGKITTNELGDVMRILGAAPSQIELEETIKAIEKNGNNLIEFKKFMMIYRRKMETQDSEEDLIDEFKKLDVEGNGKITESALRNLMSNYDNALSSEEIDNMINKQAVYAELHPNVNEYKIVKQGGEEEGEHDKKEEHIEEIKKEIESIQEEDPEEEKEKINTEDKDNEKTDNKESIEDLKNEILEFN